MASPTPLVRCRTIEHADLARVLALLEAGFPERSRERWVLALNRLSEHPTPAGLPKYGYLLEADSELVGVILVIFSSSVVEGQVRVRGNVSGWYVVPAYRSHAAMLASHALGHKGVTFLNISPARHTWPILEAQGYTKFGAGQFFAVPALCAPQPRVAVRAAAHDLKPGMGLSQSEVDLLLSHAEYGCHSVVVDSADGRYPFVFARRWERWKGIKFPYGLVAYCRGSDVFVRFAGPLGRFLALRGMPVICIDANQPILGLAGKFVEWGPRFFKGPNPPRLGDVAYTERVMFGF
ncbi:MAG TPA: hypothetical protein VMH39_02430 [Gemmatimonadaceae bacterium]|nr:hypothetical protein [Gemmatimonadaceae bacterium]